MRAWRLGWRLRRSPELRALASGADVIVAEHSSAIYPVWQCRDLNLRAPLVLGAAAAIHVLTRTWAPRHPGQRMP